MALHQHLRVGLPLKFFLSISLITVLTSVSLTLFFVRNQSAQIRSALIGKCSTLARNLAYNSEYGVLTANREFLLKLTEGVVKEDEVVYSLVYDKNRRLLARSETDAARNAYKETEPVFNALLGSSKMLKVFMKDPNMKVFQKSFRSRTNEPIYDIVYPIIVEHRTGSREEIALMHDADSAGPSQELIGFAHVGVSFARMNRQIAALREGVMLLTLIVVLFGIVLSYFLVRVIVRPIKLLALGTQKIAKGDLDYRVEIDSQDEIGELAKLFNQMAADLKHYIRELTKEKEGLLNLKMALEQRTTELEETIVKVKNIQQELLRSEQFATLGRLAASVAHELRNPLASLKNISYYLMKVGVFTDEKARQMLSMLSTDVGRANKIVTDLLDFSYVRKLNKVPVKVSEFIPRLLSSLNLGENIQVATELEPVVASMDPDRITQVLTNLIMNAKDTMPLGGQITVTAVKSGNFVEILVRDTGYGIDEETADHLFEPLFSTKTKGLGLGLAIVKEIIDAHYGQIKVASEKGKGTTFIILLPL